MNRWLRAYVNRGRDFLLRPLSRELSRHRPDAASQLGLEAAYRALRADGARLPAWRDAGFSAYSQTDEDGLLLYLFTLLGASNKRCVEICAGDGIECNTANLLINHGWSGLLVDGNEALVHRGRQFYASHPATRLWPPVFAHEWVTRKNLNTLLRQHRFTGDIDLCSIDVDGMDYWLWEALEACEPRVVVIEYQTCLGPDRSWTVPYQDDFCAYDHSVTRDIPNYAGASLRALVKLGRKKGYRLVGVNRYGFNAFFVREDLGDDALPEADVESCFSHPWARWSMHERFPKIQDKPWQEV